MHTYNLFLVPFLYFQWLNGIEILRHSIGHLPFEAEVTESLKFGAENRLTVLCNNTLTRATVPQGDVVKLLTDSGNKTIQTYTFDFFNYAGIHRSVVLYTTPKVYIQDIHITTDVRMAERTDSSESLENDDNEDDRGIVGVVDFTVLLSDFDDNDDLYYLHLQLRDSDEIVSNEMCREIPFNGSLLVQNPKLWWPYLMNPAYGHLYTLEVYLHAAADNSLIDVYRMKIGIRKLEWDKQSLKLNGKKVYMHGFGRHEDSEVSNNICILTTGR